MTDTRFPKPVFHGDTVHVRTTVKDLVATARAGRTPVS